MEIVVNGEPAVIGAGMTIQQWVESNKVTYATAIIEYNGEILTRDRWLATTLQAGDRLEVFQFLGGG